MTTRTSRKFDPPVRFSNGQKMGRFQFGSTVVMVFEAPRQFKLELDEGEHIKYGQRVSDD
ncbi:Phosphatidylserine decarboxylase proenzyme [Aphelenchoides avenae]|nr:Phosphatidylserine decarboxylase proenzyme [Aphelenchus avenae]